MHPRFPDFYARRIFRPAVKRLAWSRCGGACESCGAPLADGNTHFDHVLPHALSCESSLANCQVLCKTCHVAKTATLDVPAIAKANRQRDRALGIAGPGRGRRPMPGGRDDPRRRTVDGRIVDRATGAPWR